MSTIKFEKGKFYKTRNGEKAECVHTSAGGCSPFLFVIAGEDFFNVRQDGMFYSDGDTCEYDIISEWVEERVVWVVCGGETNALSVLNSYPAAKHLFNCYGDSQLRSLTRVVIQDGHVDTE